MDFSQFKAVEVSNKKKANSLPPKVQEFDDLKYRKSTNKGVVTSKFTISTARFNELNLTEFALRPFIHPTDKNLILMGVVADEDGKMLRKRTNKTTKESIDKGKNFKSDTLETALEAAGVINPATASEENQFIAMEKVGENTVVDKVKCRVVFLLKKGQKKANLKGESAPAVAAETATATAQAPAAQPAAAAAPAVAPAVGAGWE